MGSGLCIAGVARVSCSLYILALLCSDAAGQLASRITPPPTLDVGETFGADALPLGDIDCDGKADMLIVEQYAGLARDHMLLWAVASGSHMQRYLLRLDHWKDKPPGWSDLRAQDVADYDARVFGGGDLDGDGNDDFVTVRSKDRQSTVNIAGYGGVDGANLWAYELRWREVAYATIIGDVDGDGRADVLVCGFQSHQKSAAVDMCVISAKTGGTIATPIAPSGFTSSVSYVARLKHANSECAHGVAFIASLPEAACQVFTLKWSSGKAAWAVRTISTKQPYVRSITCVDDANADGLCDLMLGYDDTVRVLSGADGAVLCTITGIPGEGFGRSVCSVWETRSAEYRGAFVGAPAAGVAEGALYKVDPALAKKQKLDIETQLSLWHLAEKVRDVGDRDGDGCGDVVVCCDHSISGEPGTVLIVSGANGSVITKYRKEKGRIVESQAQ
jgi:hypothetical protein